MGCSVVTMSQSGMVGEIREWLLVSGLTTPSLECLKLELPEWADRLKAMGVTEVLPPTRNNGLVNNLLTLWMKQAMAPEDRDQVEEEKLINLISAFHQKKQGGAS